MGFLISKVAGRAVSLIRAVVTLEAEWQCVDEQSDRALLMNQFAWKREAALTVHATKRIILTMNYAAYDGEFNP